MLGSTAFSELEERSTSQFQHKNITLSLRVSLAQSKALRGSLRQDPHHWNLGHLENASRSFNVSPDGHFP